MEDTKKQIKLEIVKIQEATSKKNKEILSETLSKGILVKGILKLAGRWIPEYPPREIKDEEIFNTAFKDFNSDAVVGHYE